MVDACLVCAVWIRTPTPALGAEAGMGGSGAQLRLPARLVAAGMTVNDLAQLLDHHGTT